MAPHYDQPADITARLANRIVLELVTGMAERRVAAARRDLTSEGLRPPDA